MAVLIAWAALEAVGPAAAQSVEVAREYRSAHGAEILADYAELLRLPNVASDSADIWRLARHLSDRLDGYGFATELLTVPDAPPVVLGTLDVGANRTLALYVHYDGQPVDTARWTHDPWEPVLYTRSMELGGVPRPFPESGAAIDSDWRIYARSASDDKVPFAALFTVLDAFRDGGITPTSNLLVFLEGEEEAGSPHLGEIIARYRDRLDADAWLFLDGPMHTSGAPQLTFGVRGVTGLSVTVYGASRSLHSGHYGNWAPVPGMMLARLLASMKDETGRVLVDGFYDSVVPLGDEEQAALDALPDHDPALMRDLGLARTEGEPESLMERILLPSLTVKGLESGNVGPLTRNVIPSEATAELGIRLVKGNDPVRMQELVEAHIVDRGYHIVRDDPDLETRLAHPRIAKVVRERGYPAARTSMSLPIVRDVIEATRRVAGDDLLLVPGLGGSLPLHHFTDTLGRPGIIVPIANADNNQHAPDENIRIGNIWFGVELYAALLSMP
ncbi:MAG: M20/M25/M40 family metallo-hydrolase [Longimicrobiales bacterium]|nr:M20/M25/M40 family metallo-hydrolase [Longimicrobiales bacterium]